MGTNQQETHSRDWSRMARKWWPALAAGAAVVIAILWFAGNGDSSEGSAEAGSDSTAAGEHAEQDSMVTLDSAALRLAGIELVSAAPAGSDALVANGTITYDADHVSMISPRAEGRVVAVRADLGEQVTASRVLAVMESSEVGQMRGDLERSRANLDVARRNYEREKRLFAQSITPQKELLEAEGTFRSAEADYRSSISRLRAVGASAGQGATFGLASPITGVVVERNASPGQAAGPSTTLFTVANLKHVWITVDVYEADLTRVRLGAPALVTPSALGGETFPGRVTYAGGIVDPASRTFKVRVELENTNMRLRPGMFAQVRITAPGPAANTGGTLTVPEIAVQELEGRQVVFVAGPARGQFLIRTVTVGAPIAGGSVNITTGLRPGERVVAKGAFQLKAEMLKASFGEGH